MVLDLAFTLFVSQGFYLLRDSERVLKKKDCCNSLRVINE
jgi:hypothetical protein